MDAHTSPVNGGDGATAPPTKTFMYRKLVPGDIRAFYGVDDVPDVNGWVFLVEGEMIGIGAVTRDPEIAGTIMDEDARLFGFFDVKRTPDEIGIGMVGVKQMRKHIREFTEPIYVQCDDYNFEQAPRLLKMLGFQPTDETRVDRRNKQHLRVWVWQPSQQ